MNKKTILLSLAILTSVGCTSCTKGKKPGNSTINSSEIDSTNIESTVPQHTHLAAKDYYHDDTYHWNKCCVTGCEEIMNKEEHDFDKIEIIKEATTTTEGLKRKTCTKCGYSKEEPYILSEKKEQFDKTKQALINTMNYQGTITYKKSSYNQEKYDNEITTVDGKNNVGLTKKYRISSTGEETVNSVTKIVKNEDLYYKIQSDSQASKVDKDYAVSQYFNESLMDYIKNQSYIYISDSYEEFIKDIENMIEKELYYGRFNYCKDLVNYDVQYNYSVDGEINCFYLKVDFVLDGTFIIGISYEYEFNNDYLISFKFKSDINKKIFDEGNPNEITYDFDYEFDSELYNETNDVIDNYDLSTITNEEYLTSTLYFNDEVYGMLQCILTDNRKLEEVLKEQAGYMVPENSIWDGKLYLDKNYQKELDKEEMSSSKMPKACYAKLTPAEGCAIVRYNYNVDYNTYKYLYYVNGMYNPFYVEQKIYKVSDTSTIIVGENDDTSNFDLSYKINDNVIEKGAELSLESGKVYVIDVNSFFKE